MAANRRARRIRFDDFEELGCNGGNEGPDEEEVVEESSKSDEAAMSAGPKEMPPSPEDAGAQGSGEASPVRSSPPAGVAKKAKTNSKRVKKPPPALQEEDEAEDYGDSSPARYPLDDTADSGHNKRAATPKRGEKRSPSQQQEDERPGKRAAGPDAETVAASVLQLMKKSKGLTKLTSPPELLELAVNDNRQGTSSSPDNHMYCAHGEEQQEKEVANQEDEDEDEDEPDEDEDEDEHEDEAEDEETGVQVNGKALQWWKAPSTKPHSSESKKPAVERSWSYGDEFKILNALAKHAQSHNGALLESSHLLANLSFDKIDANEDKLNDKIRKLRTRYHRLVSRGCPSDDYGRRLFKLSEILWGQVDEDERVEPTSRDFSVLSKLYPYLSKEIKAHAETQSSGDLIMAMFKTIGDEKARDLDAKCKKQHVEAFKLELAQANLTKEILSALILPV